MKKSKNIKFLVLILTLALVISSMVLVVASAAGEETLPAIVGANLSQEGDNRIVIAVDASTASEDVTVVVSSEGSEEQTLNYYAREAIKINGEDAEKECYLFLTPYIGQKDIAKTYSFKAVDGSNESEVSTLSVAEYYYLRLFRDGAVDAAEGKTLAQKELYIANLNAGAKAQNLFYNFDADATNDIAVLANEYNLAIIPGSDVALYDNDTTVVTLPAFGGTVPEGKVFVDYSVAKYDADFVKSVTTADAGAEITIDAHTVVTSNFKDEFIAGTGKYYSNPIYGGQRFEYSSLTANANLLTDAVDKNKVEVIDGKLVYTDVTDVGEDYLRWNYTDKPTDMYSPKFIFETDFMFDGMTASSIIAQKILLQANGISHQVTPVLENVDDNATERETMTIGGIVLTAGDWANIRLELDYSASTIEYFLNGRSVGSATLESGSNTNKRILWYMMAAQTGGSISFDNTFVGWVDNREGGTYYNDQTIAGTRYDADELLANITTNGGTAEIVEGNLKYTGVSGNSVSFNYTASAEGLESPILVFEADMVLDATSSRNIYMNLNGYGKCLALDVQYWNNKGVENVYLAPNNSSSGGASLLRYQEYNVRFELDYANSTLKTYVDGSLKNTKALESNYTDIEEGIQSVEVEFGASGAFSFDNVFIGFVEDGTN